MSGYRTITSLQRDNAGCRRCLEAGYPIDPRPIFRGRQGQPAYGFLLKDSSGTVKVIGLGQVEVKEGDQVIVEGIFSRLRQAGRTIIYNEIKALSIKSLNRLNPDLVG